MRPKLAHRLAKKRGQTVTEVVTQALRAQKPPAGAKREVPRKQAEETFRQLLALSEIGGRRKKPGASSDHTDLYDEFGLPK